MKRDTPQDQEFKRRLRSEFLSVIKRAQEMGYTVDKFAETLGITRAALHKYTRKEDQSIPSLRVLERARRIWKIRLNYGKEDFTRTIAASNQLEFQFSVADITKETIQVQKVVRKGSKSVEVLLKIDLAKRA